MIRNPSISDLQQTVGDSGAGAKLFLHGPAGTGKTTAGVEWLTHLLEGGVPGGEILVIVPQRSLGVPYYEAAVDPALPPGGQVTVQTLGGVAQRTVELFWPLVAEDAGFGLPDRAPTFLTLETAQYYMARLVGPLLARGAFQSLVIDRNRIFSQILDNLNKSAVVGFPYIEIGRRLSDASAGDLDRQHVYEDAQRCATLFREHCLAHNLLDFSLQFDVFARYLWPMPLCRNYLLSTYRHVIVDNVEEDTPVVHDILVEWLSACESVLVISDEDAGYRRFLGADPESAARVAGVCERKIEFSESFTATPQLQALGSELARSLNQPPVVGAGDPRQVLVMQYHRYYPEMLDWVAEKVAELVQSEGVSPGEIAVLAPFLTDALRFALVDRLERKGLTTRSHRPSRALRDEPATRCLLTLAELAHPSWGMPPSRFDVAYALMLAIEGLDLVRAQMLSQIVYRVRGGVPALSAFEMIKPDMQQRLTFVLGERYDRLREWLEGYAGGETQPMDHFLSQLFGEVLSQPGFGFHDDYDAAAVAANLIESIQKFRRVAGLGGGVPGGKPLGQEYVEMVRDGVVAATYVTDWRLQPEDAVLLAPANTFLMNNRSVDYQFWLNVGGNGWWERLNQPLTQPYVLSRQWPPGAVWGDADEVATQRVVMFRLALGLVRRCRRKIYLGLSELSEQGTDQKGAFLVAFQRMLQRLRSADIDGQGAPADGVEADDV